MGRDIRSVAIVGGGLAGLTCAFRLQQRGIPAVVFEASPGLGGRAPAATYLLGSNVYPAAFQLIDELGLRPAVIGISPVAGQFYKGHVYHHRVASVTGLLGFRGLTLADKAMLSRMAFLLVRYASKLDFHHPELGIDLDDETVASFVKRELSQNILNYVAGPLISTLFLYGSEETSKLLYLNLARYMHNMDMSTLRGGLGLLTSALAQRVKSEVGRTVSSIGLSGSEFLVDGNRFSEVVLAVPGDSVLKISGMRELLGVEDQAFFENCRYGRAVAVSVRTEAMVDRCYALFIPRVEKLRAATIIFHDFIEPGDKRVTIVGGGEGVTAQELLEDFDKVYPGRPRGAVDEVQEWLAAMPKFPPGRFREVAGFMTRQRRPGLSFCGDYLMGPFLEASIHTGNGAAERIIAST